jgi:uncharacterized protein
VQTLDPTLLAIALAGLLAAGIVKGTTGLGFASCALPFLVPALGLQAAMTVVLAPTIATNVGVALGAGQLAATSRRFAGFYAATLPGIAVGVWLLSWCDQEWAGRLLGVCILVYAGLALSQPAATLSPSAARLLQGPAGFANGLLTGLTGSQVVPLLPYMMALGLAPDRLVQAINLSVLISSLALGVILALGGALDPSWLAVSMAAVVPALLGVSLGVRVRPRISAVRFRTLVLVLLLVMGFMLAAR